MQIIFIIVSAITLVSAVLVVSVRNLFHAALYMMLSFLGVAAMYALLESGFMAATQLLVYIGAISILVIFAIMMTRRLMQTTESPFNSIWPMAGVSAAALFIFVGSIILQAFSLDPAIAGGPPAAEAAVQNNVNQLGVAFTSADQLVLPFELASVLLLVALVGSIIVARPDENVELEATSMLPSEPVVAVQSEVEDAL